MPPLMSARSWGTGFDVGLPELKEEDVETKRRLDAEKGEFVPIPRMCSRRVLARSITWKIEKQNDTAQLKSYIKGEAAFRTDLFNGHAPHGNMLDIIRQFLRDGEATKAV